MASSPVFQHTFTLVPSAEGVGAVLLIMSVPLEVSDVTVTSPSADWTNVTVTVASLSATARTVTVASGGGVRCASGSVKFAAGSVSYNAAEESGGAVYNGDGSALIMSGSACISSSGVTKANDVFLVPGTKVYIDGESALSATGIAAFLSVQNASDGLQVLSLFHDATTTVPDNYGKFSLTENAPYAITTEGTLTSCQTASTLASYLESLSANTETTAHEITLKLTSTDDFAAVKQILNSSGKYVDITLFLEPMLDSLPQLSGSSEGAFSDCNLITGMTLPYGMTSIGGFAFYACRKLSRLELPATLKSTSYRDFCASYQLKSLTLPDGLETIGTQSLGIEGLTTIEIPASVRSIADDAFVQASGLTAITVNAGNAKYKDVDGVLYTVDGKDLMCIPRGISGDFAIPDGVTRIGAYSVYEDSKLSSITIPTSVQYIGERAFEGCKDNITFLGTQEEWNAISKASGWQGLSSWRTITKIICSDGTIEL